MAISINNWNERISIPIEILNGQRLAHLLVRNNYDVAQMEEDIKGQPLVPLGRKRATLVKNKIGKKFFKKKNVLIS